MQTWEAKLISLVLTFVLPFACTIAPYWLSPWIVSKGAKGERFLCYMMCFGGGIFFGTFMLHMAPEVRHILDEMLLIPNDIGYPVTDLIIGLGFFFVLYLEKAVMRINKRAVQKKERQMRQNCRVYGNQASEQVPYGQVCANCRLGKPCMGQANESYLKHDGDYAMMTNLEDAAVVTPEKSPVEANPNAVETKSITLSEHGGIPDKTKADSISTSGESDHDDHGHHNMRSLILIIAISLHHIFEGLALGLQATVQRVFTLLIALMCHEVIISFSLGLQFVKARYSFKRMIITTVCCSIIMPIGVAIGMIMTEVGSGSEAVDLASGIVQAFACGTFIFVTFFEILQEEIDPHDTSFGKVTGAFLGFVVMALMTLIPEEPEQAATPATEATTFYTSMLTTA